MSKNNLSKTRVLVTTPQATNDLNRYTNAHVLELISGQCVILSRSISIYAESKNKACETLYFVFMIRFHVDDLELVE